MKFISVPAVVAVAICLAGCARMKVSYESEPTYDFGQIRTYEWIQPSPEIAEQDDTYFNENLQQALNSELASRGWEQVLEAGGATIQVMYYVKIKAHQEYVESATRQDSEFSGGLVLKNGEWRYEEREPDQQVYTVETGILNMMVADTASGKLVWRGSLQTKLDRSAPIEKQHELFHLAAHKLLEQLPSRSRR